MPTHPRAVILDMGNVLIFHDNAKLARVLGEHCGRSGPDVERLLLSDAWLSDAINRGTLDAEGLYQKVCSVLGLAVAREKFAELWSCHFRVHEEVLPLVQALKPKVQLLLLSNTNAWHVNHCRRALPILATFDHLLFSNEVGLIKPERAFYELAVTKAQVSPAECVFFDDIERYVDAARQAGLQARVFTTAEAFRSQLAELGL